MKYYEIVLYSTHAVQRIRGISENEVSKFKAWLLSDNNKPYELVFNNGLYRSNTESTVIFKNNLVNVDFDLMKE